MSSLREQKKKLCKLCSFVVKIVQVVPKKVHDSEIMLRGAFRYLSSLTMILGTLI